MSEINFKRIKISDLKKLVVDNIEDIIVEEKINNDEVESETVERDVVDEDIQFIELED